MSFRFFAEDEQVKARQAQSEVDAKQVQEEAERKKDEAIDRRAALSPAEMQNVRQEAIQQLLELHEWFGKLLADDAEAAESFINVQMKYVMEEEI